MVEQIGVVGAGTMGAGIALTALQAGLRVVLYDVSADALNRAREYAEKHLTKKGNAEALQNLTLSRELSGLAETQIIIEAALEDLNTKRDIFGQLESMCPASTLLATNTSTLSITAIAGKLNHPARVAGMHFFNPAPVLPLIEVIRGMQTRQETIDSLVELAQRLGKTPVVAKDTPGFIVNRCARPFYLEALRILEEGIATAEQIDLVMQLGGGFKMGPFRLMDLIGLDVSLAATQSIYEQTFHEPRYRPSRTQAQMVAAGLLGRKTGKGFYDDSAAQWDTAVGQVAILNILVEAAAKNTILDDLPVEIISFFQSAGVTHIKPLLERPGLILPRILCQIINEAAFAVGEAVADRDTIDRAMRLGVNYPKGPFEWGAEIGFGQVKAVIDHLYEFYREERYRPAPYLQLLVSSEE